MTEAWGKPVGAEDRDICARLRATTGVSARSVYDFVNGPTPDAVVAALVEELRTAEHPTIREGLMRALTTPKASGIAVDELFAQFVKTDDDYLKFVAMNALSATVRREHARRLVDIAGSVSPPDTEALLADALGRTRSSEAVPVLRTLLRREDGVALHAARALVAVDPAFAIDALPRLQDIVATGQPADRRSAEGTIRRIAGLRQLYS
jgi:HEAT repeat protein